MASSALMLLSLLTHNNNNIMKHMFDVNYLKTLEKRKMMHLNKSYYEHQRNKMNENKAQLLFNAHERTHKKYYLNNYNFAKR
jgi:hypothetical protein